MLPNLASTIIVFVPLMLANAILLEAALSYPRRRRAAAEPLVGDDDRRRHPHHPGGDPPRRSCPGIMLVLAVLGMNVFGDGVRDALDPRAKIRIER